MFIMSESASGKRVGDTTVKIEAHQLDEHIAVHLSCDVLVLLFSTKLIVDVSLPLIDHFFKTFAPTSAQRLFQVYFSKNVLI